MQQGRRAQPIYARQVGITLSLDLAPVASRQHTTSTLPIVRSASDLFVPLPCLVRPCTDKTLLCLDPAGQVLTRIWCLFEIWQASLSCMPALHAA